LPQLIDFYEEFEARRDEFEIIAFHRQNKKTFEELDPDLEECKTKYWKGRDLPFPILLDDTGDTIRQLGITGYPTVLLVDPEGKLRKERGEGALRRELMKTDPAVAKHLKRLRRAGTGSFSRVAKGVAAKDEEAAAWALMLFASDEEEPPSEKKVLAILPALARMTSESAHTFLCGKQGLASESAKVRLAAVKALKKVKDPPDSLPWMLSRAVKREEDKKVRKLLEAWLEELEEKAEKERAGK
jgi:hypothetical protein